MPRTGYNQAGIEREPRGRSCISRHSASSPKAREGDPTARGRLASFHQNLTKEGGGIEPHRAVTRLIAYKAASTPNRLRLPNKSRALSTPGSWLAFRFWRTRREAERLQSVVSRIDYATIFQSDFRAEHSPIGRFSSMWLCHFTPRVVGFNAHRV